MGRSRGLDLLEKINDGRLQKVPPAEIQKIRTSISIEIEELLEVGARIRPLYAGTEQIGWVRGVHLSERKHLKRYFKDPVDLIEHTLRLGTSLPHDYLASLSATELRSLLRVVVEMTNSDLRLYPYISAFVTTSLSEQLWFSMGAKVSTFNSKTIQLPDGAEMSLVSAPDQARLWAALCNYREKAKTRLDDTTNALLIVRAWVGKGADGLAADLKSSARMLLPDILEPWTEAVRVKKPISLDDGWAHGEDSSTEGLLREMKGMVSNDKHERTFAKFEAEARAKAEAQVHAISKKVIDRGGMDFIDMKRETLTGEQVKARAAEMRKKRGQTRRIAEEIEGSGVAKLQKYE